MPRLTGRHGGVVDGLRESEELAHHHCLCDGPLAAARSAGQEHGGPGDGHRAGLLGAHRPPVCLRGSGERVGRCGQIAGGLFGGVRPCGERARRLPRDGRPGVLVLDVDAAQPVDECA